LVAYAGHSTTAATTLEATGGTIIGIVAGMLLVVWCVKNGWIGMLFGLLLFVCLEVVASIGCSDGGVGVGVGGVAWDFENGTTSACSWLVWWW